MTTDDATLIRELLARADDLDTEAAKIRARADKLRQTAAELSAEAGIAVPSSRSHRNDGLADSAQVSSRSAKATAAWRSRSAPPVGEAFLRWLGTESIASWCARGIVRDPNGALLKRSRVAGWLRKSHPNPAPPWFKTAVAKASGGRVPESDWDIA